MQELRALVTSLELRPRGTLVWGTTRDGIDVELRLVPRPPTYDLELRATPPNPHVSVSLTPRDLWLGSDDDLVRTGDLLFDELVALRCDLPLVTLFDHANRPRLCSLVRAHQLVIDAGRIVVYLPATPPGLAGLLSDVQALAHHLAQTDLEHLVQRHLDDPNPRVRDHFNLLSKRDPALARLVLSVRADTALAAADISHEALVAQVRDPELSLERRASAFEQMLRKFPWADTLKRKARLTPFLGALASQDRGAPLERLVATTLPLWLDPELDQDDAFELLSLVWSVRPSSANPLTGHVAKIVAHLKHPQTIPWLAELANTKDVDHYDDVLAAIDALGVGRPELRKLFQPSTRPLLTARAPAYARTHRRGAAFVELAAAFLPPAAAPQLAQLIELLGDLGDPASAPYLLSHLEHSHDAVRDAALVSIGRCATPNALPHLDPFTSGLFRSSRTKQLARDAMSLIRLRAGDAPGALSLVDAAPGALSLPDE